MIILKLFNSIPCLLAVLQVLRQVQLCLVVLEVVAALVDRARLQVFSNFLEVLAVLLEVLDEVPLFLRLPGVVSEGVRAGKAV